MPEEATLKDALVSDPVPEPVTQAGGAPPPPDELKIPRIMEAPDPDAAEIGRVLLASGWSKERLNDLLQAPAALESLRYTVQNNPQEFLNMVERSDPRAGEQFLERMADTYVQRYGDKASGGGKPKDGEDSSGLLREVEALREKTNRLENAAQRREQEAALAGIRQRYNARVDDLFGQVKELGLKPSEQKALRARLDVELAKDPSATQRASNGNFVDVPRVFQGLVDEWAGDRKAATEAERTQRERSANNAFPEFSLGPQSQIPPDLLAKSSESWDDTESALAKAIDRLAR